MTAIKATLESGRVAAGIGVQDIKNTVKEAKILVQATAIVGGEIQKAIQQTGVVFTKNDRVVSPVAEVSANVKPLQASGFIDYTKPDAGIVAKQYEKVVRERAREDRRSQVHATAVNVSGSESFVGKMPTYLAGLLREQKSSQAKAIAHELLTKDPNAAKDQTPDFINKIIEQRKSDRAKSLAYRLQGKEEPVPDAPMSPVTSAVVASSDRKPFETGLNQATVRARNRQVRASIN